MNTILFLHYTDLNIDRLCDIMNGTLDPDVEADGFDSSGII